SKDDTWLVQLLEQMRAQQNSAHLIKNEVKKSCNGLTDLHQIMSTNVDGSRLSSECTMIKLNSFPPFSISTDEKLALAPTSNDQWNNLSTKNEEKSSNNNCNNQQQKLKLGRPRSRARLTKT